MEAYTYWLLLVAIVSGRCSTASGIKTTCEVPSVSEGETTDVSCHFTEDVTTSGKRFRIYKFGFDDFNRTDPILDCQWRGGATICDVAPGFKFGDHQYGKTITLTILSATQGNAGRYVCQTVGSAPEDLETCNFTLLDETTPDTDAGFTTETTQSATTQSANTAASATVSTSSVVLLSVLLPVALVVVVVLVILKRKTIKNFLVRRRWCGFGEDPRPANENGAPVTCDHRAEGDSLMGNGQQDKQNGAPQVPEDTRHCNV